MNIDEYDKIVMKLWCDVYCAYISCPNTSKSQAQYTAKDAVTEFKRNFPKPV